MFQASYFTVCCIQSENITMFKTICSSYLRLDNVKNTSAYLIDTQLKFNLLPLKDICISLKTFTKQPDKRSRNF